LTSCVDRLAVDPTSGDRGVDMKISADAVPMKAMKSERNVAKGSILP